MTNYWQCEYGGEGYTEEEKSAAVTDNDFPCEHPENREHDCPLNNKNENQRDLCQLVSIK